MKNFLESGLAALLLTLAHLTWISIFLFNGKYTIAIIPLLLHGICSAAFILRNNLRDGTWRF